MEEIQMKKEEKAPQVKKSKNENESGGPSKCKASDCKTEAKKFGFCLEHYEHFMAGVIRGDGQKPLDYSEKLALFQRKKQKVA
jgi:hypothetical protein